MNANNPFIHATAIGVLVGTTALMPVASAQQEPAPLSGRAPMPASRAQLGQSEFARDPPAQSVLTREQLEAFALVASEPADKVALRLLLDPEMLPLAIEAADARTQRLRTGKKLTILGCGGAGAGLVLGVVGAIALANYHSPCTEEAGGGCIDFNGLFFLELIIVGGMLAVGGVIVLGVGIRKLNRPSDAEEKALDRYYPPGSSRPKVAPPRSFDPEYSLAHPQGLPAKTFSLPLLSSSF